MIFAAIKLSSREVFWLLCVLSVGMMLLLLAVNRVPLKYTIRNLTVRWKTTLLTALAFTLVVGLMVVMLAFTTGMRNLTENTGQPGNVILLAEGAPDEGLSNITDSSDLANIETEKAVLKDPKTGKALASRETYMVVNQAMAHPTAGKVQRRFVQLRGIVDINLAAQVHNVELLPGGKWFSEAGVEQLADEKNQAAAIQAVLGEGVARELANDRTPEERAATKTPGILGVGDRFRMGERTWIVTGVMKSLGSTFGSEVWAKQSLIGPVFGKDNFTSVLLRTGGAQEAADFTKFINKSFKSASVVAQPEKEYYASLSETNGQFLYAILFVTAIMAVGGTLGVTNTMFAAISQRVKDIGVLRLLGYLRNQILISVLLESLFIALVGGLLGCLIGACFNGAVATSVVGGQAGGKSVVVQLVVDADVLAAGLLLTLVMGTIGGLFPAVLATRQKLLDSLR